MNIEHEEIRQEARNDARQLLEQDDVRRYGAAFAARLKEWEAGGPELTDAENERLLAGFDPDELLIGRYVDGELGAREAAAVAERLRTDGTFYRRARPQLVLDAMLRGRPSVPTQPRGPSRQAPRERTPTPRRSIVRRMLSRPIVIVTACLIGLGYIGATAGNVWARRTQTTASERREGRANTTHFWPRTSHFESGATADTVTLGEADVLLTPHGRLETGLPWPPTSHQFATLDGTAVLDVRKIGLRVMTATADMLLSQGHYEIESVPGSGVTTVRVYSGSAGVHAPAEDLKAPRTRVAAGHEARVDADGNIEESVISNEPQGESPRASQGASPRAVRP